MVPEDSPLAGQMGCCLIHKLSNKANYLYMYSAEFFFFFNNSDVRFKVTAGINFIKCAHELWGSVETSSTIWRYSPLDGEGGHVMQSSHGTEQGTGVWRGKMTF